MAAQDGMTDFDFVESIYRGGIAAKADRVGMQRLSEKERSVVLVWFAKGIIDIGGFAYFYHSTDTSIDDVACAFHEVGCQEAAEACLASKNVFIGGIPPRDWSKRRRFVESVHDLPAKRDPWATCDVVIWGLDERFDTAVADYIRQNPRAFNLVD